MTAHVVDPADAPLAPVPSTVLRVLVTGATGYVGSRVIPSLLHDGHEVVAASRSAGGTQDYPWDSEVETRELDIADDDQVARAVAGMDAVIYLVHSMGSEDFVRKDREAAERLARACDEAGVARIVYVSGLIPDGELSDHLRSRQEVEEVLLAGPVPAVVLRASMVIGAGSTSYELLKRLSERVPFVTPIPASMVSRIQPVAVEDMVTLIARVLRTDPVNGHFDVGGSEVLTYRELLALYADVAGLRRRRFLVHGVPQWLVGRACAWIAGMPVMEVTALMASLRHDMVCREDSVVETFLEPGYTFLGVEEALRRSLDPTGRAGTSSAGDVQSAAPTDPA